MNKKMLLARKAKLEARRDELIKRSEASEDIAEVRSINERLREIIEDLKDVENDLMAIAEDAAKAGEADGGREGGEGERPREGEGAEGRSFKVLGAYGEAPKIESRGERPVKDYTESVEYRKAFMNYVQGKASAMPADIVRRAAEESALVGTVSTDDLGAIIPVTIMRELINELTDVYGQLYAKVRKLNIKGGVKFPIANLKAGFKWINESTVSPRQGAGDIKDFVEFSYNIGEIRVAQTLLSSIVALDTFENEVVRLMTEAYVEAMDKGIVWGSGEGQMLGILNDPRVTKRKGATITMTDEQISDWAEWRKEFFAKLPLKQRRGEFIFATSTVESYLLTMKDNNNRPIFYEATGLEVNDLDRSTSGRFFGREVTLVEPDVVPDFDTAKPGDVIGIYWQPSEYAINTNLAFGVKRYFDEDRNEWVNKALTVVDGKTLNPAGFYLIVKG